MEEWFPWRWTACWSLPGVGRKTASCVLVYAFGKAAIPVDTHVHRISNRLGWVKTKTPEKTEFALRQNIPEKDWIDLNDLLVFHGKNVCKPIRPLCSICSIEKYCAKIIARGNDGLRTLKNCATGLKKERPVLRFIGLGYVGLPMAIEFAKAGYPVVGIDNDPGRVEQLKEGRTYILDVNEKELQEVKSRLTATNIFRALVEADAVIICVPTPLRKTKDPDMSYILSATTEIARYLHKGQLIILESTTYPGTTEEIILPELESTGMKVGSDFFLAFSPERIDPGNPKYNIRNTPKIVGGVTYSCGELTEILYQAIVEKVVRVSSARSAEMVKLLENTFRAINIGMVNEVAIMCDKLGIDTWEVIDAAASKPFRLHAFLPGSRPGRALHPDRSALSVLEAEDFELFGKIH